MSYVIELAQPVTIRQGSLTPAKKPAKSKSIQSAVVKPIEVPVKEYEIVLRVGIAFADKQLNKKGWFVDGEEFEAEVKKQAAYLASDVWSTLFNFPPTFEMVTQWVCEQITPLVKQVEYVEIENKTLGVVIQYVP